MRLYNEKIDEDIIKQYIITGQIDLEDRFIKIIDANLNEFAVKLFNSLREEGYSLNTTQFCINGGGAIVLKKFGHVVQKNVHYNFDIHANAKGYEELVKLALAKKAG